MIAILALLLSTSIAAEMPESMLKVAEAIDLANAGDRRGANKVLDKVLDKEPNQVDARVARGVNFYVMGEHDKARDDLAKAYNGAVWEHKDVEQISMTEVSATTSTLDLTEQRRTGAAMLVVIAARDGKISEGSDLIGRSMAVFGDHPQAHAAQARLLLADGKGSEAWTQLRMALVEPDSTLFVQSVASEMMALDPKGAPLEVSDWLKAAGQWTAHYNAAIGHFQDRRYGGCVDEADLGLQAFPEHERMLEIGYPCAARADLVKAKEWLDVLGGPRKAEPWSVLAHGRLLAETKRTNEALDLVAKIPAKKGTDLAQQIETLQLEVLLKEGRLDDAIRYSRGHAAEAELQVGYALIEKERWAESEKLLDGVCPDLKGTSTEGHCLKLLEYARSRQ